MNHLGSLDVIDWMGPEAKREDYEDLLKVVQGLVNDPEMWKEEEEK
jgi:hypothetical protein